jgi:hypothetical protein
VVVNSVGQRLADELVEPVLGQDDRQPGMAGRATCLGRGSDDPLTPNRQAGPVRVDHRGHVGSRVRRGMPLPVREVWLELAWARQ